MVLIFLVLAAQFNSFRDPFVILVGSVPLAMFGALALTFLKMPNPNMPFWTDGWTTTLNVYSQVGLVTLVGLVAKNGILIVEFANKLQREGRSKMDAVKNAAVVRLAPILMTSVATVFGHFPLTLVTGPGAAARNSIGLVLVAGMAVGTAFTLFFVPAIYLLIARDHGKKARAAQAGARSASEGRGHLGISARRDPSGGRRGFALPPWRGRGRRPPVAGVRPGPRVDGWRGAGHPHARSELDGSVSVHRPEFLDGGADPFCHRRPAWRMDVPGGWPGTRRRPSGR